MHTIKGGWVGQTFALATSNDSGGRKSRIRRSKEERKTMVESFIKNETWGGTSKKSPDPNRLMTFLKGFISAFVKSWTE